MTHLRLDVMWFESMLRHHKRRMRTIQTNSLPHGKTQTWVSFVPSCGALVQGVLCRRDRAAYGPSASEKNFPSLFAVMSYSVACFFEEYCLIEHYALSVS